MKAESVLFGWGQGTHNPLLPGNNNSPIDFHDNGFGVIAAIPGLAANPKYDSYVNVGHTPKNIGQPRISPLDPKLAGNRTSWPVGTKSNQPPPTYTPGQISVAPPRPAKPTGGAPGLSPPVEQNPPQPLAPAAPIATKPPILAQTPAPANKPGYTTITGNWEDGVPDNDKRQIKTSPTPNACSPPQIPKPEEDLGVMPAISGFPKKPPGGAGSNNGILDNLPPSPTTPNHKRQKHQPQNSSVDDLGLFLNISGVPDKPPAIIAKIECGSLYEVQGSLRYIC